MKKNEMFRDWEFRYRYIYRKRRTKKSKQRFLSALVSDRTYRSAFDADIAVELMIDEVKNFDMEVFLAFQRVVHDIDMDEFLNNKIF